MTQLLSGKSKGRFAAPPTETVKRSPWAYVPIMVLLPLTMIVGIFAMVSAATYMMCDGMDKAQCISISLLPVENGTYGSVGRFTAGLIVIAILVAIFAAVRMKRGPVWLCWTLAALAFATVVVAFLMLNGSLPTPVGTLVPLDPHTIPNR